MRRLLQDVLSRETPVSPAEISDLVEGAEVEDFLPKIRKGGFFSSGIFKVWGD